jgi:hypothetical protein
MKTIYTQRWFRTSIPLIALAALLVSTRVDAASLTPATLEAWEQYVNSAKTQVEQRSRSGQTYLWVDEAPERLAKVKAGEIVVSPVGPQNPKRVPSGLIHDWMGAAFIPDVRLNDVVGVVRDYARYKDLFQPAVVDSKLVAAGENYDCFSMVLMNKSFFAKFALDADYRADHVRLDDQRAYIISRTTRVQEIQDYGSPSQHQLSEGEGLGLIWRLFSITRLVERDGGVYIEIEAIGLSRDIPGSVRWFVAPIVRNLSRQSLKTSLEQTERGVRSSRIELANGKPKGGSY